MARLGRLVPWLVLLAILWGLYRFTLLGAHTTPLAAPCTTADCQAPLSLVRTPASRDHLLVHARLGDADAMLLVDTGATHTVIFRSAAERLGLMERTRSVVSALNLDYQWNRVAGIDRLELGAWTFADFEALLIDGLEIQEALRAPIAGVLGINVLGLQPFEIDFGDSPTLTLGRTQVIFRGSLPPGARDSEIAMTERGNGYFVEATVGAMTWPFLVDTGAVPSEIDGATDLSALAARIERNQATTVDATGSRSEMIESIRLPSLAIGPVVRRNFPVDIGHRALLGADFFRGWLLRIDPAEGRLTIRSPGDTAWR